jgi:hypothetical protein
MELQKFVELTLDRLRSCRLGEQTEVHLDLNVCIKPAQYMHDMARNSNVRFADEHIEVIEENSPHNRSDSYIQRIMIVTRL